VDPQIRMAATDDRMLIFSPSKARSGFSVQALPFVYER